MDKNYTNYNQRTYNPKKAVKSFQDLEIYQKALEASVFAAKTMVGAYEAKQKRAASKRKAKTSKKLSQNEAASLKETKEYIIKNLVACALSIPHLIAEAHSCRFGTDNRCLLLLDEVMLKCNKMVVYLEQARDICELGLEFEQFAEQILKYFTIRRKTLNLQRVWQKYIQTKS